MSTHAQPDKVTVTGHYDDYGACRQIFVYLNGDDVTASDVAEAVRAVFRPDPGVTHRNDTTGQTKAFPLVGINGHSVNPGPPNAEAKWFHE